jgi:hypothetical protein
MECNFIGVWTAHYAPEAGPDSCPEETPADTCRESPFAPGMVSSGILAGEPIDAGFYDRGREFLYVSG